MKNLLIFTFILLYKKILNKDCDQEVCSGCVRLGVSKFFNCICSDCQKKTYDQKCSQRYCDMCKEFNEKIVFDCICDNGYYENGGNMKKEGSSSVVICISIVFSVLCILLIACCCYYNCRKNENNPRVIVGNNIQANNEFNRNIGYINNNINVYNNNRNVALDVNNINYNIDSHSNIINPVKKELTLEEILTNEIYLGPKKCKKEYEKYNIECSICLEKYKDDIDMVCLTPCSHLFHYKCLYDYFHKNEKAKCPNCNYDIINHYQK